MILVFGVTSACGSSSVDTGILPTTEPEISPYFTPSLIPIETAISEENTPTPLSLPTPTAFRYTVVTGDTLLGIAARFEITLEELLAANPEADPYLLSVGAELIIPDSTGEGGVASLGMMPTPIPVDEIEPVCFPTASGGLWCLWLVQNNHTTPLENLSAVVRLFDFRGEELLSQTAFAPLNVLWQGDEIPLMTYFSPPVPSWSEVQFQLETALEVIGEDRYLPGKVNNLQVQLSENGLSAIVSGAVSLQGEGNSASNIWVTAVAYNAEDTVVGSRRWEGGGIEAGGYSQFFILVYSLGPPIDRVEVLVEARP
jgi:LysM repeat protein